MSSCIAFVMIKRHLFGQFACQIWGHIWANKKLGARDQILVGWG